MVVNETLWLALKSNYTVLIIIKMVPLKLACVEIHDKLISKSRLYELFVRTSRILENDIK